MERQPVPILSFLARLGLPLVQEWLAVLGPEAWSWGGRVSLSVQKGKGETESAYLI